MASRASFENVIDKSLCSKKNLSVDRKLIKEMLSNINIVEVLSDTYGLVLEQQTDHRYRGACPFPDHRDSSPSFDVSDEYGNYKCWGCGRSGDLIEFFMKIDGDSFREALIRVSILAGVNLGEYNGELKKIIRDMNNLIENYQNLYCQTDLPMGISDVQFLSLMAQRLREHEKKTNFDLTEIKWTSIVYKHLDNYDENQDYKEMSKMWEKLGTRIKERYKDYVSRSVAS